jgi:dynein heavy chain
VNNYYLSVLVVPELLSGLTLAPGPSSFKSPDPSKLEYVNYAKYIEERFPPENPQMFWLHPNAEINYLTSQGIGIFNTITSISGGGSGGGGGDIAVATPIITGYQSQLPANLDMIEIRSKVKAEDMSPFILVSFAEAEKINELMSTMRFSMTELEMGIGGQLNITEKMEDLAKDLQLNQVNSAWGEKAYPSLKLLKPWFEDLMERVNQVVEWTAKLVLLKSICLSYLFNPMSFLTSNMQIAARTNSLPLDFMTNRCRFYNSRSIADVPVAAKGVNIHGLYMEGAGWEDGKGDDEGYIQQSKMKELHPVMPYCNVFSVHIDDMDWTAMYHCPVFTTSRRGATYVFQANVRMDPDEQEVTWILAGAALLLQDD